MEEKVSAVGGSDPSSPIHGWNQPDHPHLRRQKGIQLTIAAWAVEIIAAAIGLFIAIATALSTHEEIISTGGSGASAADWMTIFIGALPFLMVAIVELTKIPLANAFYFSQSLAWKFIFMAALALLIFITFETMLNGFQRNFESRVFLITELKTDLVNKIANLRQARSETDRLKSTTPESVQDELERTQSEIRKNRAAELEGLDKQRADILAGSTPGNLSAHSNEKERLERQLKELRSAEQKEIEDTRAKAASDSAALNSRLQSEKDQIGARLSQLDNQIASLNTQLKQELESCLLCGDIRTRYAKLLGDAADERNKLVSQRDKLTGASAGADLREGLASAISNIRDSYAKRLNDVETRIRSITDQIDSRLRRSSSEVRPIIAAIDERRKEATERHKEQLQQAQERFKTQMAEIETRQSRVQGIEADISAIEIERNQIRNRINIKAKDNQIYQIAALWYGHEAPADVTKDQIKIVSLVWFGSLSLIVAITGTVLAFAGLVVQYHERRPRTTLGDIIAPFARLTRSIQKLVADMRRRVREPKIKIVTRTVEVPREVIREVPVDKIVFKEIPKEVIKKELVYVPLFTSDPELLNVDFSASVKAKGAAE
ncbi:MAG: hypothetical protein RIA64_14235 [Rhodospirillales bacterium]